jgi:sulfite reductase alpha subunit-like flavoprotein
MNITRQKLEALKNWLVGQRREGGASLVVYPPEDELTFRAGYEEIIRELQAKERALHIVDFRPLLFDVLEAKGLLQKAFELDAAGSRDVRRNLAGMVQREALRRVHTAAEQMPNSILCCAHTAALHPWMSFSAFLEETENTVPNTLVIPFPGTENGPVLHFLGVKDGYNYRAARI